MKSPQVGKVLRKKTNNSYDVYANGSYYFGVKSNITRAFREGHYVVLIFSDHDKNQPTIAGKATVRYPEES